MSGSLLGPDQIKKINSALPKLVVHIRTLLAADHTAVGLMRAHLMVESFDSDEMFKIFQELSFISPREKLALVRAAIYQLVACEPALFIAPAAIIVQQTLAAGGVAVDVSRIAPLETQEVGHAKIYTPPQFKLNVATSNAAESAKTDTKPEPIVTSTHTAKIAEAIKAGDDARIEQQKKLDAAVAKLREVNTPIEIPIVPEDATIPQE